MKLLFYNCVYRPGHMYYDTKMIGYLSKIADKLIVLQPESWFDIKCRNIEYVNCEVKQKNKTRFKRLSMWVRSAFNSLNAAKVIRKKMPDIVVVGEYELATFGITFPILKVACSNIVIVNHNNIDQLVKSGFKRKMFSNYKDKVYHCTLEPFVKEYVQNVFDLKEDKVFCWPHPAEPVEKRKIEDLKFEQGSKCIDVIGLSQSNDESIIRSLINAEKVNGIFRKNHLHAVLKSKENCYDDGFLKVIQGWINEEDYKNYYKNTKSVLVAFPPTYRYRVSATLIEAIRDNIQVIGANIELMNYYNKEYPNICRIFNLDSFISDLVNMQNVDSFLRNCEFKRFMSCHSDEYITNLISQNLNSLL